MKKFPIRKPARKEQSVSASALKKPITFTQSIILLILATLVLFGASGYYWYTNVLTNPDRILAGMLEKSLQTKSINRTVTQMQGDNKVTQKMQTQFSPVVVTKTVTNLSEINDLGRTTVVTESIGTNNNDYIRYTDIDIQNPQNKRNFSSVLNTWGARSNNAETGEAVSFLNTALFVAVPFGDLNAGQRNIIKNEISKNNLYKYQEAKIEYISGRPVMNYEIDLSPQSLVTVLSKYVETTGIGSKADLDPASYQGVDAIKIKLRVDVLSRHVQSIEFLNSNRSETYQAYNSASPISTPNNTISIDKLQSRLSEIENKQQ